MQVFNLTYKRYFDSWSLEYINLKKTKFIYYKCCLVFLKENTFLILKVLSFKENLVGS